MTLAYYIAVAGPDIVGALRDTDANVWLGSVRVAVNPGVFLASLQANPDLAHIYCPVSFPAQPARAENISPTDPLLLQAIALAPPPPA